MENQELQKTDDSPKALQLNIPADTPMMTRLAMMLEGGVKIDVEQMSKMQEMAERFEANEARKSFSAAFTIAQANISAVIKTKWNPQTSSNYADLGSVINMVKPVYTAQGFSVIFYEGETTVEKNIRICADVLHRDGHKETYHYDVPLGGKGIAGKVNMIDIHAKATSVTYGERYLLSMIWNIPTADNDGNPPPPPAPIEVPDPTDAEWDVINLVCAAIPPVTGSVVSPEKVASLCFASRREYPRNKKTVDAIAEWIAGAFQQTQIYDEIKSPNEQPGTFE